MGKMSRRAFGRYAGVLSVTLAAAGAGGTLAGCGITNRGKGTSAVLDKRTYNTLDPRNAANFTTALRVPRAGGGLFGILDLPATPIDVTARRRSMDMLNGKSTEALAYEVQANDTTYLNPVFCVQTGATIAPRLINGLDEPTIIHWHGLHVDWRNDGHPSYAVGGGASYDYRFAVQNRAGTYWYHPHPHKVTAQQAYRGLAGLFIVDDDDDQRLRQSLDLDLGVTDIPLVLQDRLFDARGNLVYAPGPMEQFSGVVGDVMLVNGTVNPVLEAEARVYRFRILNGSNARLYRLSIVKGSDRLPVQLIGTDGGLLTQPRQISEMFLAPAERVDLLVDLRGLNTGDVLFLKSHTFDPMHSEMAGMSATSSPQGGGHGGMGGMSGMSGMDSASRLADGEEFNILKLTVKAAAPYDRSIPTTLSRLTPIDTSNAAARSFTLSASGMQWLINGAQFEMERELFRTRSNTVEVWEITNARESMPHPMHLHGFQFQVLERRGSPAQLRDMVVDSQGRIATDLGWKDTVLVWPGEAVKIAIDFTNTFSGEQLYTFHCHNLEHEDGGMMVNYRLPST